MYRADSRFANTGNVSSSFYTHQHYFCLAVLLYNLGTRCITYLYYVMILVIVLLFCKLNRRNSIT